MSRRMTFFVMPIYCIGLLLACDLAYSNFFHTPERFFRAPDPRFDHSLTPNFDGYDLMIRFYRVYTNSLGFKDAAVREVPAKSNHRRVLLIGDSFTEGLGLPFEQTFAGLLYRAGNQRSDKIEFLNAGVVSYSPTIYYQKIKHLIESGLHFDEVVVFSDISDVPDEATGYFCIDDDPQYRMHCHDERQRYTGPKRTIWQRNFVVIDATHRYIKARINARKPLTPPQLLERLEKSPLARWTISDVEKLEPLGIEGGIKRSLHNMQKLADLLAHNNIKLTVAVYPWMLQLAADDRDSRQVAIWRDFCVKNCRTFINLFPVFFAAKDANPDWLDRLFTPGDFHFSPEGNEIVFREVARSLFEQSAGGSEVGVDARPANAFN